MKKYSVIVVALFAVAVLAGCSKGYVSQKIAGDVVITVKADRYPLVKGDNDLSVTVTDKAGKPVTDAAVVVRFYMPPMPGMAPMDNTIQAVAKGDHYELVVNAPMEGGWKMEVSETQPGKQPATATFNLDAR